MQWIDEMISKTKQNKAAESAKRKRTHQKIDSLQHSDKQSDSSTDAWVALLSTLRNNVNEFNNNKSRAGHSPVLMSDEAPSIAQFQFEVYLPEMSSKLLVLNLAANSLHILVRPAYPEQQSTITLETDKTTLRNCWMLGAKGDARKEISVEQLSELLLEPILAAAEID